MQLSVGGGEHAVGVQQGEEFLVGVLRFFQSFSAIRGACFEEELRYVVVYRQVSNTAALPLGP